MISVPCLKSKSLELREPELLGARWKAEDAAGENIMSSDRRNETTVVPRPQIRPTIYKQLRPSPVKPAVDFATIPAISANFPLASLRA